MPYMCKYERARYSFSQMRSMYKTSSFQHHGTYKFFSEKPNASIWNPSGHIEDDII
jgi:hypothetical protein